MYSILVLTRVFIQSRTLLLGLFKHWMGVVGTVSLRSYKLQYAELRRRAGVGVSIDRSCSNLELSKRLRRPDVPLAVLPVVMKQ